MYMTHISLKWQSFVEMCLAPAWAFGKGPTTCIADVMSWSKCLEELLMPYICRESYVMVSVVTSFPDDVPTLSHIRKLKLVYHCVIPVACLCMSKHSSIPQEYSALHYSDVLRALQTAQWMGAVRSMHPQHFEESDSQASSGALGIRNERCSFLWRVTWSLKLFWRYGCLWILGACTYFASKRPVVGRSKILHLNAQFFFGLYLIERNICEIWINASSFRRIGLFCSLVTTWDSALSIWPFRPVRWKTSGPRLETISSHCGCWPQFNSQRTCFPINSLSKYLAQQNIVIIESCSIIIMFCWCQNALKICHRSHISLSRIL